MAVGCSVYILDYLDGESSAYCGCSLYVRTLQIPYVINTNMVRGLDYYNHTIFEFTTEVAGSQRLICAGVMMGCCLLWRS